MKVRIGTRGSDLALWQARFVAGRLEAARGPDGEPVDVEIVVLKTRGDAIDDRPLTEIEGKSFFTAEIERALLDSTVDVAVHSHKDLETEGPPGLSIAAVPARGPAHEVLVIAPAAHDPEAPMLPLAIGATVGTGSPRRAGQLRALRPDLRVEPLRGNVPTRARRVGSGLDAACLAAAGIERLQLDLGGRVLAPIAPERLVPAPAQGALAVQVRADDARTASLCRAALHDEATARAVAAERSVLARAGGGCHLPLGASVTRAPDGAWRALAFLGRDHPEPGAPARWAEARGAEPEAAAAGVLAALAEGAPTGCGPLAGRVVALTGSGDEESALARHLSELGARVVHERVLAIEDLGEPGAPSPAARVLAALVDGDVLAVTSRRAARRLAGERVPDGALVAAVGPATARALEQAVGRVDVRGAGGAAELAAAIAARARPGARVVFACAAEARPELSEALAARGFAVEPVVLYRTRPAGAVRLEPRVDARVYLSPSAVAAGAPHEPDAGALRVPLGAATAEALAARGLAAAALHAGRSGPEACALALLARLAPSPRPERIP